MANVVNRLLIGLGNFVLWASGILLLVFGAVALGSPSSIVWILNLIPGVSNVTNLINIQPLFNGVSIFMVVLGSLLFLFGIAGAAATGSNNKTALMLYWILLIIGVLVEIALIIYAALFNADSYIQQELYTSLVTFFIPVGVASNGDVTYSSNLTAASWELLQSQSHCCGAYDLNDYLNYSHSWNSSYPPTCCKSKMPLGENISNVYSNLTNYDQCISGKTTCGCIYTEGCWHNVANMVWNYDLISIIISACIIAVQLLLIPVTIRQWRGNDGVV